MKKELWQGTGLWKYTILIPGDGKYTRIKKDYAGGFAVDLMAKDLGLAAAAGLETKLPHRWEAQH